MKKRILQFIPSFHQGGSERQAISITRRLKDDGLFEVHVATLNKHGALLCEAQDLGAGEMPEFSLTSFHDANFLRQLLRCVRYLKDKKIDLVHTHDFYTNVFGITAAALAGVPVRIASKRETGAVRSRAQQFAEKLAFSGATTVVANSEAVRSYLAQRSIAASKICVIHNGVDLTRFNGSRPRRSEVLTGLGLGDLNGGQLVTLVANLRHDVKNVPLFLRAARLVAARLPDTRFIVAGEGPLKTELEKLAIDIGIGDRTHFVGRATEVSCLLSISDVCVLTSKAEGFSNSILEYMAAGRPVVATNVGGAAEAIIHGETGYLVSSDDNDAMADNIVELLNDAELAARFGEKGRSIIEERFGLDRQMAKITELYESAFSRSASTDRQKGTILSEQQSCCPGPLISNKM